MEPLFNGLFSAMLIVMLVLYGACTEYRAPELSANGIARYPMFQDVNVMIFIGFGFLMCFLHRSGMTATSHSFLVAAFSILWCMLCRGFWRRIFRWDATWDKMTMGVDELISGEFCAGAVLISFGALIGRVSAAQLLAMAFFETILYSFNEALLVHKLGVADVGGSVTIHAFGAIFGLTVSYVLGRCDDQKKKSTDDNMSTDLTDTLAMAGSLFLFCYWPSFVGAMSDYTSTGDRTVFNTFVSISTSVLVAFFLSSAVYGNQFRMVEVQNSTLAGGVAIGTAADMCIGPAGAMAIGAIAGAVSVCGYRFIQMPLDEDYGLKDTCGVMHLHGMPGLIGGFAGVIASSLAEQDKYGNTLTTVFPARANITGSPWDGTRTAHGQANVQLAGVFITFGVALVSGAIVGKMLQFFPQLEEFFNDHVEYQRPAPSDTLSDGRRSGGQNVAEGAGKGASPGSLLEQRSLNGSLSNMENAGLGAVAPRHRNARRTSLDRGHHGGGIMEPLNQEPQNDEEEGLTFHS